MAVNGTHRIGLLLFPGKKQDLEQKEPELGAGSTQGMQLPEEFVPVQMIPVEQLQPRQQLPSEIRPDRPGNLVARLVPDGRDEIVERRSGRCKNERKMLGWGVWQTHRLGGEPIGTNRICQPKTQPPPRAAGKRRGLQSSSKQSRKTGLKS